MAHLITDHDPFHIHKILGLLVLLNYIYRFYLLATLGTAFPKYEDPIFASAAVGVHGLLSWSSLLLPLPKKRNFNSPMIWPEFRLHSILFGSRHVVFTILTLMNWWPSHFILVTLSKTGLIVATTLFASTITDKFGDKKNRTTNAMPYPPTISIKEQKKIKKTYTRAQFLATVSCLYNDPSMNFTPLLAIQVAPLLMTFVRKGKIKAIWYHRIYYVSLFLPFVVTCMRAWMGVETDSVFFGALLTFRLVYRPRLKYSQPAWFLWARAGILLLAVYPNFLQNFVLRSGFVVFIKYFMVYSPFHLIRIHYSSIEALFFKGFLSHIKSIQE